MPLYKFEIVAFEMEYLFQMLQRKKLMLLEDRLVRYLAIRVIKNKVFDANLNLILFDFQKPNKK